jgi:Calcium binding
VLFPKVSGDELGHWGEYLTFRTEGGVIRADAPQQVHMHGKAMMRKNRRLPRISKARLEEMTEQATVDAYSESEQITGWFTMIEENLGVPFETTVLGVPVTVDGVDLNRSEQIVAVCKRGRIRQSLPILDLPLPTPLPVGAEWIEAYRRWRAEDD